MSITITQSVAAKFVASGNTDFSGSQGIWFGRIPAKASTNLPDIELPFLGFTHGGETPKYTSERQYKDEGTFNFAIYAITVAETERLALIVLNIFDAFICSPRGLDFTNGYCIGWYRTRYMVDIEAIENEDAKFAGRVDIQYAYTTQKTLPAAA